MSQHDTEGFRRFKEKRAARAADDAAYADFLSAMQGPAPDRNGVASSGTPGGPASEGVSDATIYRAYMDQITGRADRRRAEEMVKQELRDREAETVRHVREVGGGLSSSHEHLRSRLSGFGRPHEGS